MPNLIRHHAVGRYSVTDTYVPDLTYRVTCATVFVPFLPPLSSAVFHSAVPWFLQSRCSTSRQSFFHPSLARSQCSTALSIRLAVLGVPPDLALPRPLWFLLSRCSTSRQLSFHASSARTQCSTALSIHLAVLRLPALPQRPTVLALRARFKPVHKCMLLLLPTYPYNILAERLTCPDSLYVPSRPSPWLLTSVLECRPLKLPVEAPPSRP